jgi:signal transduction histidine kinase/ligand-binding sensor domain-containing protein
LRLETKQNSCISHAAGIEQRSIIQATQPTDPGPMRIPDLRHAFGLLALITFLSGTASAQVLPFTYITTEREINPLPSAEVHRVIQDSSGVIWIGVYSSGLAMYDGTALDLLSTDDGLRDLLIWDVLEDAGGRLWVASNAGLVMSEQSVRSLGPGDTVQFTDQWGDIPLADVAVRMNNISAAPDGSVWVGTGSDGLIRYQSARADTLLYPDQDGFMPSVQAVLATADRTYISLSDRRIIIADSSGARRVTFAQDEMPEANVNLLYSAPDGTIYAGSAAGELFEIRDTGLRHVGGPYGSNISSVLLRRDGSMWIGTQGSGLVIRQGGSERVLTRENGLLSETIHHIFEDAEGSIWLSQTGGIARLRPNFAAFENYTARSFRGETPVLPAAAINAVLPLNNAPCTILAATAEAGVACIRSDGSSTQISESLGLASDWVNALALADDGAAWAGTLRGISRIRLTGSGMTPETFGGASILAIRRIEHRIGPSGQLQTLTWFPAYQTVYAYGPSGWLILRDAAGLPATVYQSVDIAPDGHLLIGTRDRGLFRSTHPATIEWLESLQTQSSALSRSGAGAIGREVLDLAFEPLLIDGELPSQQIDAIMRVEELLWLATPRGIAVVGGDYRLMEVIDRTAGLPADNVISMARDERRGSIWAGTNRGLAEIDVETRTTRRVVTQQDGLVNNEGWFLGSVALDDLGNVLYGTANGVSRYLPAKDVRDIPPTRVRIRQASVTSARGRSNEALFEYAALSFFDEKQTVFRTRILGYDASWSAPTADTRLRYTNLPAWLFPRTYTFEVIAAGADGAWTSEPARYQFRIAPPWWLAWWAFAIYAVVLAVGVIAVHNIQHSRTVRREREKAQLREAELRAETANARSEAAEAQSRALLAENERKAIELQKARELERAYYDLKAAQSRLVQAEKMASLGRLAAGIAHEIKNPLNFINNFAALSKDLVSELREILDNAETLSPEELDEEVNALLTDLETNSEKVMEHGKRADGIVRGMLMHSRGSETQAISVDINSFVDEYMNLAYHGMRAQHPDFNTAIEREFDPSSPSVPVAPQEVGRVIINLLNNAFYAVREKERVTPGYSPVVRVETISTDDGVSIKVRDNGPGIPAHIREKIFEPFFTTKPTGEGTGLGLSLSYDIITQGHGGQLTVDSRQGDFTEFVIELPFTNGRADQAPARGEASVDLG